MTNQTHLTLSSQELEQYLDQLQEEHLPLYLPSILLLVLLALTGLCGNSLVLVLYKTKFKVNPTRIFMMAMAGSDLAANVISVPGNLHTLTHMWNHHSQLLCRLVGYTSTFTTVMTVFSLVALCVARYRLICRPTEWQVTTRQANISVLCMLLTSCFLSIPYCVASGLAKVNTPLPGVHGRVCAYDDVYDNTPLPLFTNIFYLSSFVVLCFPMLILYAKIGVQAYRHRKTHNKTNTFPIKASASVNYTQSNEDNLVDESNEDGILEIHDRNSDSHDINTVGETFTNSSLEEDQQYSGRCCKAEEDFTHEGNSSPSSLVETMDSLMKTHQLSERATLNGDKCTFSSILQTSDDNNISSFSTFMTSGIKFTTIPVVKIDLSHDQGNLTSGNTDLKNVLHTDTGSFEDEEQVQSHSVFTLHGADADDVSQHSKDKKSQNNLGHNLNTASKKIGNSSRKLSTQSVCLKTDDDVSNDNVSNNNQKPSLNETHERMHECEGTSQNEVFPNVNSTEAAGKLNINKGIGNDKNSNHRFQKTDEDWKTTRDRKKTKSKTSKPISRTTLMIIAITTVFILGYLPFFVLIIFRESSPEQFAGMSPTSTAFFHLFFYAIFFNNSINPIIYSLFDPRFRREVLRLFSCSKTKNTSCGR